MRLAAFIAIVAFGFGIQAQEILYTMPSEEAQHEGTWLQWPHNHTYGWGANDFVPSFIEMTQALITSENVHIRRKRNSRNTLK